jgi:hypothetical protein
MARATRSMVPVYLSFEARPSTEHMSSRASMVWFRLLVRMPKRPTTSAGGIPSGITISAFARTSRPTACASVRPIHSTSGNASNPPVPAGLRICVNGNAVAGCRTPPSDKLIGAFIDVDAARELDELSCLGQVVASELEGLRVATFDAPIRPYRSVGVARQAPCLHLAHGFCLFVSMRSVSVSTLAIAPGIPSSFDSSLIHASRS